MLAAFASEQMSLRCHVETIVKPWLAANCGWIFQDRSLLLGIDKGRSTPPIRIELAVLDQLSSDNIIVAVDIKLTPSKDRAMI